ncbi:hypothetical protein H7H82_19300 [Mycobacterium heidelbergense]|uniref:DUF6602 domain-containing protein n=1 Tax=Mycobacterium heidelbergense TaxID=53376 RepID=A0A1X0D8Q8_MYCHE|nr:DUF6602 domain-containing protein [Mycobacterium heidelbergense]MCV7052712.1 hypothetical protein [Mycobacterium heidelbergense]ORA68562.1 hypothetical protein BST25_21960 [Mycobacterium heidelbergense]BBZ48965.1 hypothetical protein MHEI_06820 [Mycobacterium heidelbergense]
MTHEHHQWLADVNRSIVESYERDQEMARQPGSTQRTGHRVESRWDDVLRDWLPPQYEIGKQKYLLLETDDGPTLTKETDLVVFHPHYPEKLRVKESVLASGVAVAFSSRRTIGREDIREAYEDAITLRRGMKIREGTQQAYLVPPVFYGLLGESHDWKAPGSTPKGNIKAMTEEFDRDLVNAPREGLDFICVADLGIWGRVTTVLTERFLSQNLNVTPLMALATGTSGKESLVLSGMRHDYKQENLSPLTNFIGLLWGKLAINDLSLKPLADGFRITETTGTTGSFGMRSYKLADVTTAQIASQYRNSGPWYY